MSIFNTYSMRSLLLTVIILLPQSTALAQGRDLQSYLVSITMFFNGIIIPFFFAIAILFFFVNVTRFFVLNSHDPYKREEARTYILYSIIALVLLTSLWGIVNLLTRAIGIGGEPPICPDYLQGECDGGGFRGDFGSQFNDFSNRF